MTNEEEKTYGGLDDLQSVASLLFAIDCAIEALSRETSVAARRLAAGRETVLRLAAGRETYLRIAEIAESMPDPAADFHRLVDLVVSRGVSFLLAVDARLRNAVRAAAERQLSAVNCDMKSQIGYLIKCEVDPGEIEAMLMAES